MITTREMTCIVCPIGCALKVTLEDGKVMSVTGQRCKRGEIYAQKECSNPTRMITSTLPVEGGTLEMVPVKTAQDIPKDKIWACMEALKGIKLKAPLKSGDAVIHDVAQTGVDIVVTRNVDKAG